MTALKLSCFANSLSNFLIIVGFLDATFDYITKHDLNHSLFLFWIITNPFIELFSSLGNGKYELFSEGAISDFVKLNETLNPNLNVSSLQLLQKDHCAVFQVVHQ